MVSVSRLRVTGTVTALMLALPVLAGSQAPPRMLRRTTLVGSVRDSSGRAIPGVEVWLRGVDLYAHTNEGGGFRIPDVPSGPGKLSLRRLGFEQATVDVDLKADEPDSIVIALTAVPTNLAGMTVEEESRSKRILAGFWERRGKGMGGHFLTRDEIEDKKAHDFVGLVRMFPGVNIVNSGGRAEVRLRQEGRGDCPPLYWLDGMKVEAASAEYFPPNTLEAVEVYNGTATIPLQFQPRPNAPQKTCGVIVIWTHIPGT